jgi:hypothetical protein
VRGVAGVAGMVLVACLLSPVRAETFDLELKYLEPVSPFQNTLPADYAYRMGEPQHFFMQVGIQNQDSRSGRSFGDVISKEPAKYKSEHPLRGVAALGPHLYGFALDTTKSDSNEYTQLHFDLNRNGDLTDDKVIEGKSMEADSTPGYLPEGYWGCQFPRVDVKLDFAGRSVDYSFFLIAYSAFTDVITSFDSEETAKPTKVRFVSAALQPACYREGEILLGGKTRRVVLLDFNSNGKFDDKVQIRQSSGGRATPAYGDAMLIDPEPQAQPVGYDWTETQMTALTSIDGALFDVKVTPGGDRLTIAPSSVPVGRVKLPCDGFRGTIYSESSVVKLDGSKSEPVALPVGAWKLMSYTIDLTDQWAEKEKQESKATSLLSALTDALTGVAGSVVSRTRTTRIHASGTTGVKDLVVREGQTTALPFGPPFKPIVTASTPIRSGQTVRLGLQLTGAGGESCSSIVVDGKKPDKPEFTITTAAGEEVATGSFEYG